MFFGWSSKLEVREGWDSGFRRGGVFLLFSGSPVEDVFIVEQGSTGGVRVSVCAGLEPEGVWGVGFGGRDSPTRVCFLG